MASSPESSAKIEAAKASGIRFVQLQFTDIIGHVKAVTIPIHRLEESVEHGTWFDGSSIEGFTRIAESDQYLMPDMETFAEIPWQRGSGPRGTARVICDVFTPNGEPFVGDPRFVLRRQVERAKNMGYVVNFGPELEFFLFRRAEDGSIEPLPHDQAGYFDFSTDLAQEIRQDMVDALEAFGHQGRGGPPRGRRRAARDRLRVLGRAHDRRQRDHLQVRAQGDRPAARALRDVHAQADPRDQRLRDARPPVAVVDRGAAQRVRRCHQPVRAVRCRALVHGRDPRPRPRHDRGPRAARELVQAPRARLRGPDLPDLGPDQPVRPHPRADGLARAIRSKGTRAEVRCPDPSSNTYLAFAAMIAAGLDGVEKNMVLSDPVEESLFEMDATRIAEKGIRELPGTLGEALDELERDDVIREALGDHVFSHYVEAKRAEWDEYRTQVSDWEVERYLDQVPTPSGQ